MAADANCDNTHGMRREYEKAASWALRLLPMTIAGSHGPCQRLPSTVASQAAPLPAGRTRLGRR